MMKHFNCHNLPLRYIADKNAKTKTKYKPTFTLSENFCRTYGLDPPKRGVPLAEKDQTAYEEFNFSKAAIKFSNFMTKDNVFSGMRYIVQQIGEFMYELFVLSTSRCNLSKLEKFVGLAIA